MATSSANAAAASLAEIRRQKAEAYKKLTPAEKPKVTICADCKEATYIRQVCPISGQYHDMDKHNVIGGKVIDSKFVRSSDLMEAINMTRVKWVPSRTQLVKADASSLNIFQSFVYQMEWKLQRYGLMYGKYDESSKTVEVHAVYEPEQRGSAEEFFYETDNRVEMVDKLAAMLGLTRVGAICTHPPRNPDDILLSGKEMLLATREQSRFGDHCVLLTIAPNAESGNVECQAWQVSPQAVHFYRLGQLSPSTEDSKCVESKRPLEVAQDETDDKGRQLCLTKAPSTQIDTRWFTGFVAVQQFQSPIISNTFMRISRPAQAPPSVVNLRNYMKDPKRASQPLTTKLADFHVLIFLAEQIFDISSDMPVIVQAILEKDTERLSLYDQILKEYFLSVK